MLRTELIRPLPATLIEHATRFGGKTAFSDSRRRVTYGELEARTRRIAGHLAELRLQPGDRAVIFLGNRVETVESYLAITRASGVGVPLNPYSSDEELSCFLADSAARVVITDPAHAEQLARVAGEAGIPRVVVTGDAAVRAGTVSFEQLATTEPAAPAADDLDLDDIAWMLYTSGTTGRPKGVLSTQHNCLWSVAACYVPVPALTAADRVLWPLPLFHSLPTSPACWGHLGGRERAHHRRLRGRRDPPSAAGGVADLPCGRPHHVPLPGRGRAAERLPRPRPATRPRRRRRDDPGAADVVRGDLRCAPWWTPTVPPRPAGRSPSTGRVAPVSRVRADCPCPGSTCAWSIRRPVPTSPPAKRARRGSAAPV